MSLERKQVRNVDEEDVEPCNRSKRRVCAKKRENISIVEKGKRKYM